MSEKKIYVGGLSYNTSEEGLRQLFAQSGTVESVQIIMDHNTGRSKGFGFVVMSDGGDNAIQKFNGEQLDGRSLNVSEARPQSSKGFKTGGSRW